MKNKKGQPICGKSCDGPIYKDRGRSRPLYRFECKRVVQAVGQRCWQHGGKKSLDIQHEREHN